MHSIFHLFYVCYFVSVQNVSAKCNRLKHVRVVKLFKKIVLVYYLGGIFRVGLDCIAWLLSMYSISIAIHALR